MILAAGIIFDVPYPKNGMMNNFDRLGKRLAPAVAGYQQVFRSPAAVEPFYLTGMRLDAQELAGEEGDVIGGAEPGRPVKNVFYINSPARRAASSFDIKPWENSLIRLSTSL